MQGILTNLLLVVSDADVDAAAEELHADLTHGALVVVIGEEHLGLDDLGSIDHLIDRHRVGLVAGQEGNVDVLQVGHLGDVLGITSDVDAQTVEGEHIAVVTTFGVELLMLGGGVIGRHCLDGDISRVAAYITVLHDEAVLKVSVDSLVDVDAGSRGTYLVDGSTVEVVLMLVGDEDDVGLGEGGVVGLRLEPRTHGIDLDLDTVEIDFHAGMLNASDSYFLAALGGELVDLALCRREECGKWKEEREYKDSQGIFFHFCFLFMD